MRNLSNINFCDGDIIIREVECVDCGTTIRGKFKANRFHMFSDEELFFIEIFLKSEGSIKLVEKELGISYPTVKSRLKKIINMLGYEQKDKSSKRLEILKDLSEDKIDINEAMKSLDGLK